MVVTVFIDGEAGTTGLEIRTQLAPRSDVALLQIPEEFRKDPKWRKEALNTAEIVLLCLPDLAARESVALLENPTTRIIDASTAHRLAPGWVYGFPEMTPSQAHSIAQAQRVANPGCYPQGVIALIRPLIEAGILDSDNQITVHGVSGYSGGGRSMIEAYLHEKEHAVPFLPYNLSFSHKHLPEMRSYGGLARDPLFLPAVLNCFRGMSILIPLFLNQFKKKCSAEEIWTLFQERYSAGSFVSVAPLDRQDRIAALSPTALNHTNQMRLYVFGDLEKEQLLLAAVYDNLGKGASGSAIQCLNLMLGKDPKTGLT